jgi:hypothetical protein
VELLRRDGISINGLSLSVEDLDDIGERHLRLLSIPNIVLIEPFRADHGGAR